MYLLLTRVLAFGASATSRRLVATTFWSALSEALSRGLLFAAMVLVARMLGAESYGEFGIVRSTINVFATVGGMGLGLTANRFIAQHRDTDKILSGHIVGSSYLLAAASGLGVGILLFVTARPLAVGALHAPQLVGALRIAALLLLLGAINGAQIGVLQGLEAYRRLAISSVVQGAAAIVALVGGAHYFGLNGSIAGLLAYSAVGAVIFQESIRRELRSQAIRVTYTNFRATLPIFWSFTLPVVLAGVAIAPLKWVAETMLVRRVGFAELGLVAASMTIVNVLAGVVSTLNAPLISLAANMRDVSSTGRVAYVTLYGSWFATLAIALPFALAPSAMTALFGAKYASLQFYRVNLLLIVYCALMMYYQGIIRLVALRGTMWFGLSTNLCEGAALLTGFWLLADLGAVGLALAYVTSYVVRIAVSMPYLMRGTVVPMRLLLDKYFLATLAALIAVVAFQLMQLR